MIMAVLNDYKCVKHGYFEAYEGKCPMKGCSEEVHVVFLQPVAFKSDTTKHNDKTLNQLAIDFNMTDIKSAREDDNQSGYLTRNNGAAPAEPRPGDAVKWGNQGGKWDLGSLVKGRTFAPVRDESVSVLPSQIGNLTAPKTASYIADHENLQVKPE
jgi:hypothetical protein